MAGELAAEWIKIPDGNGNLQKVWVRDSTARRDIAQLQTDVSGLVIPNPSDASPQMDGTAAAGSSADYARADHVHPSDTSKADAATTLAGYGITDAYTKTQVDGMIPSVPSAYTSNPEMDGTASPGSSTAWARGDHVHPHDSTKADVSAIPTKTSDLTNDSGFINASAVPDPSSAAPAMDGTAAAGSSDDYARADHTHPSDTTKQDALNAAQLAAVNSGITAAKVAAYDAIQVPTKTSELTNDSGFLTSAPVASVNGQTGAVNLSASDVGAQDALTTAQLAAVNSGITSEYVNGKFFVITGTLASAAGYSSYTYLPTGCTTANCVPVGFGLYFSATRIRMGQGIGSASDRIFIDFNEDAVRIYNSVTAYAGYSYYTVFMRTDI